MTEGRNALTWGMFEPDPDNALNARPPTQADAYSYNAPVLRDAWAAARDPQTWQDAAQQYGQGLLAGSVGPEGKGMALGADALRVLREMSPGAKVAPAASRMASGLVDVASIKTGVGDPVSAHVNPSKSDLARMFQAAGGYHLRGLREGPNFAVWPALDATHGQMAAPLGFTKDAALVDYRGRPGEPDADFPHQVGRFSFWAAEH